MELNTFGAASIFKSSKDAVKKKSLGTAALNKKKEKRFLLRINLVFRYFSSKIIVISKNLKFKISQPPLNHFATHQGVATPSLKSPALYYTLYYFICLSTSSIFNVLLRKAFYNNFLNVLVLLHTMSLETKREN